MTQFPTATILGYPRIGRGRELKKALEAYWAGRISAEELRATEALLRKTTHDRLVELGLGRDDASTPKPSHSTTRFWTQSPSWVRFPSATVLSKAWICTLLSRAAMRRLRLWK